MKVESPPKLIQGKTWEGYDTKDIEAFLGPNFSLDFWHWFHGKTGVCQNNKYIVYKEDFEKFCENIGISIGA